jgi:transitional endoplasmic reticulum ATPase
MKLFIIVRDLFNRARSSAPSVIFFDEVDAIVGKRALESGAGDSSSRDPVCERVLSTLLNEMDGIETSEGLLIVVCMTHLMVWSTQN